MDKYDTSIPLKKKYFELIKSGEKLVHIDRNKRGLDRGDTIRFMVGYDPDNGSVLKDVVDVVYCPWGIVGDSTLELACVRREWVRDYAGSEGLYLIYFA